MIEIFVVVAAIAMCIIIAALVVTQREVANQGKRILNLELAVFSQTGMGPMEPRR